MRLVTAESALSRDREGNGGELLYHLRSLGFLPRYTTGISPSASLLSREYKLLT